MYYSIIQENVHTLTIPSIKCVLNLFIVFHGMKEMFNIRNKISSIMYKYLQTVNQRKSQDLLHLVSLYCGSIVQDKMNIEDEAKNNISICRRYYCMLNVLYYYSRKCPYFNKTVY